jgi:hypothetical protein
MRVGCRTGVQVLVWFSGRREQYDGKRRDGLEGRPGDGRWEMSDEQPNRAADDEEGERKRDKEREAGK